MPLAPRSCAPLKGAPDPLLLAAPVLYTMAMLLSYFPWHIGQRLARV